MAGGTQSGVQKGHRQKRGRKSDKARNDGKVVIGMWFVGLILERKRLSMFFSICVKKKLHVV